MQLVLSGNTNLALIRNVIYFAQRQYENSIAKVFFIDTQETLYNDDKSMESERNDIVRRYIPEVSIESVFLPNDKLHIEVPRLLSEKLQNEDRDNIIIDLTNGDRHITNILYATASVLRIHHLCLFEANDGKEMEEPEALQDNDYTIHTIPVLGNFEAMGNNIFFELIDYRERIEKIFLFYRNVQFESTYLQNMFESQVRGAVSNYFEEDYVETILNMGQVVEEIATELCDRIKNVAQGKIIEKLPRDFDEAIGWLRANFADPLRGKKNRELEEHEENLKNLQSVDKMIDLIRVFRNCSTHPYDCLRGKDDARLVLNNGLYLLEELSKSGIFI